MKRLSINERVKELRCYLKMNQRTFGAKIGIAQTYLSQIEKGDRDVTDKISKIICLTKWDGNIVNEEWLRSGTGEMFTPQRKSDEIARFLADVMMEDESEFKFRLTSALAKMDDKGWDEIEKLIERINEKNEKK